MPEVEKIIDLLNSKKERKPCAKITKADGCL